MKTGKCSSCKRVLPFDSFYADPTQKRGRRSRCKFCHNWYNSKSILKGVPEDYIYLENDPCHICGIEGIGKKMAIDHCHVSGEVRGRLCLNCNTALGKFNDTVELLERAILYLQGRLSYTRKSSSEDDQDKDLIL